MQKTILITGSTDGIGLEAAKRLAADGHHVILHGRNPAKLNDAQAEVRAQKGDGAVDQIVADLSRPADVATFADEVVERFDSLDVLINNAGVFGATEPLTVDGIDVRFAVNTLAPYVLTQRLLPLIGASGRVINLSSAAQEPVDSDALRGSVPLADRDAYAQSKLALNMWSRHLADEIGVDGTTIVAVNPGSLLATKMVKDAFGIDGNDIGIGADILVRAALSPEFATATGKYFDNDSGQFAPPHADALDAQKNQTVVDIIESILATLL